MYRLNHRFPKGIRFESGTTAIPVFDILGVSEGWYSCGFVRRMIISQNPPYFQLSHSYGAKRVVGIFPVSV